MINVGLTGGIGSGKSTVSARLAELGAVVIDSDALAREVVLPDTPGFAAVRRQFGPVVVGADGTLNREALGRLVFSDPDALAALNAIVHPLVRRRSAELVAAAPADAVLVHDIPLLVENGMQDDFDEVVVVRAPLELRLQRLEQRGLSRSDATARIARQATDEQRAAVATWVLANSTTLPALVGQVDDPWQGLTDGRR